VVFWGGSDAAAEAAVRKEVRARVLRFRRSCTCRCWGLVVLLE